MYAPSTDPVTFHDEGEVWQHFQKGCEKSFTYLHQKYYNDLYAYAFKFTADEYVAKNAIQELFIYLWKNKALLGKVDNVRYYLIFSLRRHLMRLLKKERKHFHVSYADTHFSRHFSFSPEDIVIKKETFLMNEQRVLSALNRLTSRQREVIYLRYFHDMRPEEIAAMLALNYQSVLNCLGRALKNLRKMMLSQQTLEIPLLMLFTSVFSLLY